MKKLIILSLLFTFCACSSKNQDIQVTPDNKPASVEIITLPEKSNPGSSLASDSPVNPQNIDDYLFLDDVQYVDLRSPEQIVSEGFIAGFENLPFYEMIVSWKEEDNILFTMKKSDNSKDYIGSPGTFFPHYEESEEILHSLFSDSKQIVFISTAGVESAYMINLLIQYGYDPSLLYNAGSFTNSVGSNISYRDYSEHKYYTEGTNAYIIKCSYSFDDLTIIP